MNEPRLRTSFPWSSTNSNTFVNKLKSLKVAKLKNENGGYDGGDEGGDESGDEGCLKCGDEDGNEGGDEGGNEGSDDSCFYDVWGFGDRWTDRQTKVIVEPL